MFYYKNHLNSKPEHHLLAFEQRPKVWENGELEDLLLEEETIQVPLRKA